MGRPGGLQGAIRKCITAPIFQANVINTSPYRYPQKVIELIEPDTMFLTFVVKFRFGLQSGRAPRRGSELIQFCKRSVTDF